MSRARPTPFTSHGMLLPAALLVGLLPLWSCSCELLFHARRACTRTLDCASGAYC
jgi:hypothetical protein